MNDITNYLMDHTILEIYTLQKRPFNLTSLLTDGKTDAQRSQILMPREVR